MTDTNVGGMPLGMFVTSAETEEIITKGLILPKSFLPESCFGGAQTKAPEIFMSDDREAQQNSLTNVFPTAKIWLCTFHVLQSVWRYVAT